MHRALFDVLAIRLTRFAKGVQRAYVIVARSRRLSEASDKWGSGVVGSMRLLRLQSSSGDLAENVAQIFDGLLKYREGVNLGAVIYRCAGSTINQSARQVISKLVTFQAVFLAADVVASESLQAVDQEPRRRSISK